MSRRRPRVGTPSRREVLKRAALLGAGLVVLPRCKRPTESVAPAPAGRALTVEELALCRAACERVLPADEDAGAGQLGVVDYVDARLRRPTQRARGALRRFRRGLGALDAWAKQHHQEGFGALDPGTQDVVLASFAAEGGAEGYAFLRQLVELTIEGAFADPAYQGNRDKKGWALLGFDAPCPNPRCR